MKKLYYIIPILLLSSCNFISRHSDGVVAEVNGHLLYQIDLESITSSATSPEDSAQRARDFIEQWATDILVYDEAKKLNTDRIEMLVEDYRRSLYIYEYEQHLVNKQMSHDVQDSTITLFYEQTKHHYILQDHIFKGILLVLPHSTPQLDQLKKWLNALNEDNMDQKFQTLSKSTREEIFSGVTRYLISDFLEITPRPEQAYKISLLFLVIFCIFISPFYNFLLE